MTRNDLKLLHIHGPCFNAPIYVTVRVVTGKPWLLCLGNAVRLLLLEQDL